MTSDGQHFVNISVFSRAVGNGQTYALFLPVFRPKLSFCSAITTQHIIHPLAAQCSRRSVVGLSPRRPKSETRPFCVRFVVDIVAEG